MFLVLISLEMVYQLAVGYYQSACLSLDPRPKMFLERVLGFGIDQKMQFRNLWFLGIWMPIVPVGLMHSSHRTVGDLPELCLGLIEMIILLSVLQRYEIGDLKFRWFEDVSQKSIIMYT